MKLRCGPEYMRGISSKHAGMNSKWEHPMITKSNSEPRVFTKLRKQPAQLTEDEHKAKHVRVESQ
jgi:hypothetical protein